MNYETLYSLKEEVVAALDQSKMLDALIKLDSLARYADRADLAEKTRKLKENYAMLLDYMRQGVKDDGRMEYYDRFRRKAYIICEQIVRSCRFTCPSLPEAQVSQRLVLTAEEVADVYVPFVEGDDGHPATLRMLLDDPLVSYQQLFDTIWTSGYWKDQERHLAYHYVTSPDAPQLNKLVMVSAAGLALLSSFDEEKFLFLLSVIEEDQVEVSVRAMMLALMAYDKYHARLSLFPEINLKFDFLVELPHFHPLVLTVQKMFLSVTESLTLAGTLDEQLPEQLREMSESCDELPKNASEEETEEFIASHPELKEQNDKLMQLMHEFITFQKKGIDVNYHSFARVKDTVPFFKEAANWFCPFTFDHPQLFNINAATRFLGVITSSKTCDTDRYALVLSMMPHLPEIHVVKHDAVTLEDTTITEDEVGGLVESLAEGLEKMKASKTDNLIGMDEAMLERLVIGNVQDSYRFFTLFKDLTAGINPFKEGALKLWKYPIFRPVFYSEEFIGQLADWIFELEKYDEAIDLYLSQSLTLDRRRRLGFAYEKLGRGNKALECYEQCLKDEPDDEWTLRQVADYCISHIDPERAIAPLLRLTELFPDDEQVLKDLAGAYFEDCQMEEAYKAYVKLDYLYPNHIHTQRRLAVCLMWQGDYVKANNLLQKNLADPSVTPSDYFRAGICAIVMDDLTSAVSYFQDYLRVSGQDYAPDDMFDEEDMVYIRKFEINPLTLKLIIDLLNI